MAETLLNLLDSKHFDAASAGIDRGEIHPLAIEVMKESGIDLTAKSTKATQEVMGLDFDFVITLSDRARYECPKFPQAEVVHWQFDDPLAQLDPVKQKRMFQSLRDQIVQRIRLFALVQTRFVDVDTNAQHHPRFQPGMTTPPQRFIEDITV